MTGSAAQDEALAPLPSSGAFFQRSQNPEASCNGSPKSMEPKDKNPIKIERFPSHSGTRKHGISTEWEVCATLFLAFFFYSPPPLFSSLCVFDLWRVCPARSCMAGRVFARCDGGKGGACGREADEIGAMEGRPSRSKLGARRSLSRQRQPRRQRQPPFHLEQQPDTPPQAACMRLCPTLIPSLRPIHVSVLSRASTRSGG